MATGWRFLIIGKQKPATIIYFAPRMLKATSQTYRSAYTGLSRSTWLLSLVMLINRSGTMVIPFMTLYLTTEKGYSIGKAGFVFGLFGFGAFSGAWIGGKLTDKIGFYPVQLITLLGGGCLFMVLGQMESYGLICLFTYLVSFVNEAFRPANSTAIAFYSKPENRTRSYSLNRLAINLGWAVGAGIGGYIAHISYELLFWVDGVTNIIAAGLMWAFVKPVNYKPSKDKQETTQKTISAYHDKKYIIFVILTMLFASCFFQLFTNMTVYFKLHHHLSEQFIGFLMALNGLIIVAVEMALIYKLEGRRHHVVYISTGIALVGTSFLLLNLPVATILLSLTMIVIVTFGEILSMPFMNSYWITRTQANNRGEYAALYTMAWSAAQTLGPMGGAQVAEHWGFSVLWWIIGAICFITSFLMKKLA